MKQKLLIFHPYLAPYRIDFFNNINKHFILKIYFQFENDPAQNFDLKTIKENVNFNYEYVLEGFKFFTQSIRFGIFNIIKKEVPDIIITHEFGFFSFAVLIFRFFNKKKIKWLISTDDSIEILDSIPSHRSIAKRILLNFVDGLITISSDSRNWHLQNYPSLHNKIFDLPILHNEKKFRLKLQESLNISKDYVKEFNLENKKIILFVGRLVEEKGILNLIKIFNSIPDKKVSLIIVGDGKLNNSIKQIISQNNDKRVLLVGRYDGLNLLAWYNISSFFILPSNYEPFGAVVNEALLAGNHVICSKNAGASCLINEGENGTLINPLDNIEIRNTLIKFITESEVISKSNLRVRKSLLKIKFNNKMESFFNFFNENSIN